MLATYQQPEVRRTEQLNTPPPKKKKQQQTNNNNKQKNPTDLNRLLKLVNKWSHATAILSV